MSKAKKERVPEIRFQGFEGEWEEKRLKDIGDSYTSLSGKTKKDFGKGEGKYITFSNVLANPITKREELGKIEIDEKQNTVKKGDVFFNISSETPLEVGMSSVWIHNDIENLYVNSFCTALRPKIKIDSYFLAYLLRSTDVRKQIILLAQGISRYNISKIKLLDTRVLLSTLPEQQKIGQLFENLDRLIELQEKTVEESKRLKRALLQKIFPKKGEATPELRLAGFTGEWKDKKLGKMCQIQTGKLDANAMQPNGKYVFFTCAKETYKIDDYAYDAEALLISGNGSQVGHIHYYKGKFNAYQRTYILDNFTEDICFIRYYLEKFLKHRINIDKNAGNIPYIKMSTLTNMNIIIPALPEQQKIGQLFKTLDDTIELEEQTLETYKKLKQSLLQKMFV